jgi:NAD(P)-dependent dehydrogenase (short-subunit alcohol dehydrogenase family)
MKPAAVVVTGAGGMGLAIARRIGTGRLVILADASETNLTSAAKQLQDDGYNVSTHQTDVSNAAFVKNLAISAAKLGNIETVVHTAGISPTMASSKRIFEVDLLGTALVIDAFEDVIAPGGSLVCIASMAGHTLHGKLPAEAEEHLAMAPSEKLLDPEILKLGDESTVHAYSFSKRANQLRVQAAARLYGSKGLRINSVSPGVIHTPMMTTVELEAAHGQIFRDMVADSATGRFGTPSDVAHVVAFLSGPEATFITGADMLVDGGSTASQRWPVTSGTK